MLDTITMGMKRELVHGTILDGIGDAMKGDFTELVSIMNSDNTRDLDGLVAKIEDTILSYDVKLSGSDPFLWDISKHELNILIRQELEDIYEEEIAKRHPGAICEKIETTLKVERAMRKVESILMTYERTSTDWIDKAREAVYKLNDPIAEAIFGWSIV